MEANLNEFSTLNRRRLFGAPPLDVADLERWGELRSALEEHYGDQLESVLSAVERRSHFRFPTHLQVRSGGLASWDEKISGETSEN